MPRTRSLAWSELKIGILAVAALVLAVMFVVAVGGQGGFAWERYELKTKFRQRPGPEGRAPSSASPASRSARSPSVDFAGAEVEITLEVNEENKSRITDRVARVDRLAEPARRADHRHQPRRPRGRRSRTATSSRARGPRASSPTSPRARRRPRAGDRAPQGHPRRQGHGRQAVHRRPALPGDQRVRGRGPGSGRHDQPGQGTLGLLINDPAAYRRANAALANLQEMTRRINAGEGSLGKLLKDEQLAKSLTATGNSSIRLPRA